MWLLLCQEKFKRFYESLKIIFKTKIKNRFCIDYIKKNQKFKSTKNGT
jgi:hypothetical protein